MQRLADPDVVFELDDTPFFPQELYQCGPAALATVLQASGVDALPEDLVTTVYIPGRRGSIRAEMLAATRTSGRIPYITDGSLAALVRELRAGRPVVVLQNLGVALIPRWHYAVVVGIDGPDEIVILRSGTDRRRETPFKVFLRTWARSDYWAFSIMQPGALPTGVDRTRYLAAVAGLEEIGQIESAELSYRAALQAWPGDPVALFGLGNSLLEMGQMHEAETIYRSLLETRPSMVAVRNNLAIALQQQARFVEARMEIERAIRDANDPAIAEELQDTRQDILRELSTPR